MARLRRPAEFEAVYEHGRKVHGKFVLWFVLKCTSDPARVGITVSKRVGNAVVRNRTRRRIREWVRRVAVSFPPGLDVVIVARPGAATVESSVLCEDLDRCMERVAGRETSSNA